MENDELMLRGLEIVVGKLSGISVVGQAADGRSGLHLALTLRPDLVLMDTEMPGMDGFEATRTIKSSQPEIAVVILAAEMNDETVVKAIESGADGYCLKSTEVETLEMAIRKVAAGGGWIDPSIAMRVMQMALGSAASSTAPPRPASEYGLTGRELEVVRFIVEGHGNCQIARTLGLSEDTVKTHVRHIMEKLEVHARTQIAVKAIRDGLVRLDRAP